MLENSVDRIFKISACTSKLLLLPKTAMSNRMTNASFGGSRPRRNVDRQLLRDAIISVVGEVEWEVLGVDALV